MMNDDTATSIVDLVIMAVVPFLAWKALVLSSSLVLHEKF
jgi:hypothetical protein